MKLGLAVKMSGLTAYYDQRFARYGIFAVSALAFRGNNRNTGCASLIIHEYQNIGVFPPFYDISQLSRGCLPKFEKKCPIVLTLLI